MTMSNRLAVMNEGRVQQFADPLTCYTEPTNEFVAGFIGSPGMNFLDAAVTEDGLSVDHFSVEFEPDRFGLSPGQAVRFGIRPEDITISDSDERITAPSEPVVATIDVVEPVGDQVFVYLLLGADQASEAQGGRADAAESDQLLISVPPDPSLTNRAEGEQIRIRIDRARAHLFDADTGDAIAHGLTEAAPSEPARQEADDTPRG